MLLSGDDFPAAIESLAQRYGIPPPAPGPRRRADGGARSRVGLEAAQAYFREQRKKNRSPALI
jgi:DNA primase